MITIKGEYEDGTIKLLEKAPSIKKHKVLITFLEEEFDEEALMRQLSLQQPIAFVDYLNDEKEDLYQEYINQPQ